MTTAISASEPHDRTKGPGPFAVSAVSALTFGAPSHTVSPPDSQAILTERFGIGSPVKGGRIGLSHGTMAGLALRHLLDGSAPSLIVLAHSGHDLTLHTLAALRATELAGIEHGAAFSVTDRGALTGFSAMRLATVLGARDGHDTLAVVMVDQEVQRSAGHAQIRDHHRGTAVALLLERNSGSCVTFQGRRGLKGATTEAVVAALDDATRVALAGSPEPEHLVLGPGVPGEWQHGMVPNARVARVGSGLPSSSPWFHLAAPPDQDAWDGASRTSTLIVAHDPVVGGVEVALVRTSPTFRSTLG